jgi:seryl-tRNA synthetase
MLDIRLLRQEPDAVRRALKERANDVSVDKVLELDGVVRKTTHEVDQLRAEKNRLSALLGKGQATDDEMTQAKSEVRALNAKIKIHETDLKNAKDELDQLLIWFPNVPHDSVPKGMGAEDNEIIRSWGERPTFDFVPAPHWEVGSVLGIIDVQRAAKVSGSNFMLFRGEGALLVRGLITFMLDLHTNEHGYTEFWTPFLATRTAMLGTGQLPKLEGDMYVCRDPELFLVPTGEVPLTNLFRDEIIDGNRLPMKLAAYTPCFRREAGAYGKDTRGLNRVHQFDKVELVKIVEPERSYDELESLVLDVEEVLKRLELPYRLLNLCAGELGFAAAKCYDLEVWSAGQERWLEVSSCSNFQDFQARRSGIRYRPSPGERPMFAHTLNGSGLALPRVIAALLENGQTREGMVRVPKALRPFLGGRDLLGGADKGK